MLFISVKVGFLCRQKGLLLERKVMPQHKKYNY